MKFKLVMVIKLAIIIKLVMAIKLVLVIKWIIILFILKKLHLNKLHSFSYFSYSIY